jgi:hydroxyethylthiazole kinase-like uncharacterized protein yjeF
MFVVTPSQMRKIDQRAIEEFKIPGIVLMENAALRTVEIIERYFPLKKRGIKTQAEIKPVETVLILAGTGNNGGDGLAVARHLYLAGCNVRVLLLSEGGRRPRGDAEINLNALNALCEKQSYPNTLFIFQVEEERDLIQAFQLIREADLIVDALFGTGLDRPVSNLCQSIINQINREADENVVSVDIPSGIHGETGIIMGAAIKAAHTVSYGYLKPGHLLYPGRMHSGRVHVVPISLPDDSPQAAEANMFTLTDREAASMLKPRDPAGHKGSFGKAAIIAGSTGMTGAAHLASLAAQRCGAGLVTLGIPASLNPIMEEKLTEVMTLPLKDNNMGHLIPESLEDVLSLLEDKDVLAFGPGCGKNAGVFDILRNILGRIDIPIVIDADGLNHISRDMNLVKSCSAPVILTPHPGEMSRMTGLETEHISRYPVQAACEAASQWGCIVVLKGAASVVAEPKGRVYINTSGNSGMAKGGSGDVLTGIIAALAAQGYCAFEAAVLGCYIHGRAGDKAARRLGETGMLPSDIIDALPGVFKDLAAENKSL